MQNLAVPERLRGKSPVFYALSASVFEQGHPPHDKLRAPALLRQVDEMIERPRPDMP